VSSRQRSAVAAQSPGTCRSVRIHSLGSLRRTVLQANVRDRFCLQPHAGRLSKHTCRFLRRLRAPALDLLGRGPAYLSQRDIRRDDLRPRPTRRYPSTSPGADPAHGPLARRCARWHDGASRLPTCRAFGLRRRPIEQSNSCEARHVVQDGLRPRLGHLFEDELGEIPVRPAGSLAVEAAGNRADRHGAARVDQERSIVPAVGSLGAVKAWRSKQGRGDWARGDGADAPSAGVQGKEKRGQTGIVL
jgi:hypothetical protein